MSVTLACPPELARALRGYLATRGEAIAAWLAQGLLDRRGRPVKLLPILQAQAIRDYLSAYPHHDVDGLIHALDALEPAAGPDPGAGDTKR